MAPPNGFSHPHESRSAMSSARVGKKKSEQHRAKISLANKGKKRAAVHERVCPCGASFKSGAHNARFCSTKCKRSLSGHGLVHAPSFSHFQKRCAVCGVEDDLVGDHDHQTGLARGILCRPCNLAIGNMKDDPRRLRSAADYLEAHLSQRVDAVYISGPMTGLPDSNYPAFHKAARHLRSQGLRVESPAENPPPVCGTWEGWMRGALRQLMRCSSIIMLPGWQASKGASLEHHVATELGMPVDFVDFL